MLEILSYEFFRNALIGGALISLASCVLGVFIVMRKEANITHSLSHFLFLGVAISLLFQANYYIFAFLFSILGSLWIFFIEKTRFVTKESTKEIISQAGMAGGIFALSFLDGLQLDIFQLLFWSILTISIQDLLILGGFTFLLYILLFLYGRNFLSLILNDYIAKSRWIPVDMYNLIFLVLLWIFLAVSIKIFWILLIGAFLVIPANIGKVLSNTLKGVFVYAFIFSIIAVVWGLFWSYYLEASSGATIVLILVLSFIGSLIYKK